MKFNTLSTTLFGLLGCYALNAHATENAYPTIPMLNVAAVTTECDSNIGKLKNELAELAQRPIAANKNQFTEQWLKDWNVFEAHFEDLYGPIEILKNVSPNAEFRNAAEKCLVKIDQFNTEIYQDADLYQRFKSIQPQDAIDRKLTKDTLMKFDRNGIGLSLDKQQQLKTMLNQMTELAQQYSRNIRDNNTKLSFSAEQLQGLPASYIQSLKQDKNGKYQLGFSYPEYRPFMELADDDAARQEYYYAFTRRGGEKNLELLKKIIDLRYQIAQLFGEKSYADWATKNKMAQTPETVHFFLENVYKHVTPLATRDAAQLAQFKAKTLNIPLTEAKIQPWNATYWSEKYKKTHFNVDQEQLRQYFPTEASLKWLLAITSELYGIRFEESKVPVWHQDVRYFNVFDAKSNQFLGGLYIDPYPREGKYGHAAVWPIYGSSTELKRTPIAVLVTNFNRKGLNANELETFVHEFGHAMHGILSNTRYVDLAGTSVERDFVEAPSQMYEEWARNEATLQKVAQYCSPACPKIDAEMMKKLKASHNFGQGLKYARQTLYAQYDMKIHGPTALKEQPLAVWKQMEAKTALGYMPNTEFPGQFDHLVNGYGAGYYGYLWSEVIALDMLSAYGNNLMNPQVGMQYRTKILSQGSQKSATALIKDFLGRDSNNDAFNAEINGNRLK